MFKKKKKIVLEIISIKMKFLYKLSTYKMIVKFILPKLVFIVDMPTSSMARFFLLALHIFFPTLSYCQEYKS